MTESLSFQGYAEEAPPSSVASEGVVAVGPLLGLVLSFVQVADGAEVVRVAVALFATHGFR